MFEFYDVIIVGAGFAGLECAKNLVNSGLKVLILEKNNKLGQKVCANGILKDDLKYIPEKLIEQDFKKIDFIINNKLIHTGSTKIISTIDREKVLNYKLKECLKDKNINIKFNSQVIDISENSVKTNKNEILKYKYLVGADGSLSQVRKYLKLKTKYIEFATQYLIPKKFSEFEIGLFKNYKGYLWIFPHKHYTSIGCGEIINYTKNNKSKLILESFLKMKKINFNPNKNQGAFLNCDYKGYKFGDIFLAGDAAGLVSKSTGKGIFAANSSGEQIAKDILGIKCNALNNWLEIKRKQDKLIIFTKGIIWNIIINLSNLIIKNKFIYKKIRSKYYK